MEQGILYCKSLYNPPLFAFPLHSHAVQTRKAEQHEKKQKRSDVSFRLGEESNSAEKGSFAEKKEYGVMEEVSAYESVQDHRKSNGGRNSRSSGPSGSNNGPHLETSTLKSNLKKTASTTTIEENQAKTDHQKRKVSWPDTAYGTDIAHVLEFEPSISDDGEVEGVRNSCVCTIQ
ncbi:LIGHT-HARVESTING COMPLEX-LIKE PROTEIN OHP2 CHLOROPLASTIC [Salix viminalis]|uniref:LIGHT-HARVESTING COMPLEX-LIKE PROTEIN OHP2 CHLOROPLASTIC n=1 Tax=Salix viminalis TaxID=40686 RepID=A0A9Q0QBH9_SALVM|nr:LIGHT-HARVESTING COMPLEX-LIKE PROTEIN OHP2 CHLOROPLASTIC [Salix viminalis]